MLRDNTQPGKLCIAYCGDDRCNCGAKAGRIPTPEQPPLEIVSVEPAPPNAPYWTLFHQTHPEGHQGPCGCRQCRQNHQGE